MRPIRTSLLTVLVAATGVAFAQTPPLTSITLNVPVQMSNYGGSRAAVWCELLNAAGKPLALPMTGGQAPFGIGVGYVTVNGGAANTTLPIGIALPRESTPLVTGWRCILTTTDTRAPDPRNVGVNAIPADLVPLAQVSGRL